MHALLQRPLRFMSTMRIHAQTRMLFLDGGGCGLEGGEVDGVGVDELLGDGDDVCDEAVEEVEGHAFAYDDPEDFGGLFGGGEGVVFFGLGGIGLGWGREHVLGIMYCFTRKSVLTLSCLT